MDGNGARDFRRFHGLACFAFFARGESVTSIAERKATTECHQYCSTPDPSDERFVVHTNAPRVVAHRLSERYVQIAKDSAVDCSLSHHIAAGGAVAFLRIHALELGAVASHNDLGTRCLVVWTNYICDTIKLKLVTARPHNIAALHAHVLLRLISSDYRHAND